MWLGRWEPLFRDANVSHQMLLALARAVSTKVVLRPEGKSRSNDTTENKWDFLFHQSGMIGSAILFANGNCGAALRKFPAQRVNDTFAVGFDAGPNSAAADTKSARHVVSKIAKLKVDRAEFDRQAAALTETNVFLTRRLSMTKRSSHHGSLTQPHRSCRSLSWTQWSPCQPQQMATRF